MDEYPNDKKRTWIEQYIERAANDLRSPIVALSFLIAVVAALPTFYSWLYPADPARLLVHYDPFTVYDPGKPVGIRIQIGVPPLPETQGGLLPTNLPDPPVKVLSLDGKVITTPIYDMEVSIWSGGSEPINRDKIRRPLVITFPHIYSFLGIRILHENPNDGLKIKDLNSSPASLQVSWDYMDPGAGFKFAAVFTTPAVLDPLQFNSYIVATTIDTDKAIPGFTIRSVVTTAGLVILFFFFMIGVQQSTSRYRRLASIVLSVFTLALGVLFALFLVSSPAPPF